MRLLIVDGNTIAYRSAIISALSNRFGERTEVLYGSLRILTKLVKDFKDSVIIVTWDAKGGSRYRKELFKEYKGNRVRSDETYQVYINVFIPQLNLLKLALGYLGVPQLEVSGVEADDLIAILAKKFKSKMEIVIVSVDKDLISLVGGNVSFYASVEKKLYTEKDVFERYKVDPENWVKMKILVGDKSDNVPAIASRIGLKKIREEAELSINELSHKYGLVVEDRYKLFKLIDDINDSRLNDNERQLLVSKMEKMKEVEFNRQQFVDQIMLRYEFKDGRIIDVFEELYKRMKSAL
jgi:DNA polymerase-1